MWVEYVRLKAGQVYYMNRKIKREYKSLLRRAYLDGHDAAKDKKSWLKAINCAKHDFWLGKMGHQT